MKKKIIIGNWKMNPTTLEEAKRIYRSIKNTCNSLSSTDIVICPPFVYLSTFLNKRIISNIKIEDSPNSAGVMIDIIRIMKLAQERGKSGVLNDVCPFYFKHPPTTCDDSLAYEKVKNFIQINE